MSEMSCLVATDTAKHPKVLQQLQMLNLRHESQLTSLLSERDMTTVVGMFV